MLLDKHNGKVEVRIAKHELASADISRATYGRALKLKTSYEIDDAGERRCEGVARSIGQCVSCRRIHVHTIR
jgi:hypothetical protein